MKSKKLWAFILTIILGALVTYLQNSKIEELQNIVDQKVDTLVLQGTIDTITIIDTIKQVNTKIVHKVDTVEDNDVVVIYDTTTIYKPSDNFAFDIRFADSTRHPYVSIYGVAHYPSGLVDIAIKDKLNFKAYDNRLKLYSGLGFASKFGPFVHVTGTMGKYSVQIMGGKGFGFSLGKRF